MKSLRDLKDLSETFPLTDRMPVLFIGHGSPMNAIEENQFVRGFKNIGAKLPKPNAILCISAHWLTKGTKVTAMDSPNTIHDFGGFPSALYEVNYPAPGNPQLAKTTATLLEPTPVILDHEWGLDHGSWSVIKHLYPEADVPVVQLSIDYGKPMEYHFQLAGQLQALRDRGILIVGSGNIIHNLRMMDFKRMNQDNYGYDWALTAKEKLDHLLINEDHQSLLEYEKLGKEVNLAIPTPDHYIPLLYILGNIQSNEEPIAFNQKMVAGSISMTSIAYGLI